MTTRRSARGVLAGLLATCLFALTTALSLPAVAARPTVFWKGNDAQLASEGVFMANDFPSGWRATPHKKSKSSLNDCPVLRKALRNVRKNRTANVTSDDFGRGNDQYTSAVVVYRTEDVARRAYAAAASPDMRRCATSLLKNEVTKKVGGQGFDVKVEGGTVTGSGSYGDESSDIGFKITASKGGLSEDVFADITFVRVGRTLGGYTRTSTSESSGLDTPTFNGLITTATSRLTNATGGQPNTGSTQTTASASAAAAVRVP